MKFSFRLLLLTCDVLVLACPGIAAEITVGTTALSIPAPAGYVAVTPEMKPYAEFLARLVVPTSEGYASFVPEQAAVQAKAGKIPEVARWFSVQTAKSVVHVTASTRQFAEFKQATKEQNQQNIKKAEAMIPGFLEKLNEGILSDYGIDPSLKEMQLLPFPVHHESERAVAYTMMSRYSLVGAGGSRSIMEGVTTVIGVHVRGKILFLYTHADKAGLEWSRLESRKWADLVIAGNPSDSATVALESKDGAAGFDWLGVLKFALIGAVAGAVSYLFRKKTPGR